MNPPRHPRGNGGRVANANQCDRSGGLDLDLLLLLLRFGALRQGHGEDALAEGCRDLVAIDAVGEREGTLERAVGALRDVPVLVLCFLLLTFLALDGENVAGYRDVDVLLVEARQFGRNLEALVVFGHVDRRRIETEACFEGGHGLERAAHGGPAESGKPVEQAIHLATQTLPRISNVPTRSRGGGLLHFNGGGGHRLSPSMLTVEEPWHDQTVTPLRL